MGWIAISAAVFAAGALGHAAPSPEVHTADVVVVGGTPGGIMSAIGAARSGCTVILLERTSHVGGLPANGLGATDIATRGATGGLFEEFVARNREYYARKYGEGSQQVRECSDGYHFEPSVGERTLEAMLAEQPRITILRMRQLDALPANVTRSGRRLIEIRVRNRDTGAVERYGAWVFVDATYEGDLASAAGVPFRVGRESSTDYNEPMAGQLYKQWGGPIGDGTTGQGDNAVQAYNYRVALTDREDNRVPIQKPATYNRADYASLVDDVRENRQTGPVGTRRGEFEWDGIGRVVNIVRLPNGKTDANNQHAAFLSTDLPEENWPWPTSSWEWRDHMAQRLRDYTLGLLWFVQHDAALPAGFRARCSKWGLARDEYRDNGNFPRQVYVREGRRIVGGYLFTARDAMPVVGGSRPPVHASSITASHYALDSHACRKREPGRVHLEGFFSYPSAPYTVPYEVMVPKGVDGLLVPVAASATHVGYSTLRMEPCWMALGQAAGVAAGICVAAGVEPRTVDIGKMQRELLRQKAVLIYYRDVTPNHPDYAALQILGLKGVLPGWNAEPDRPVTAEDADRWRKAVGVDAAVPYEPGKTTRGQYLTALLGHVVL